MASVRKSSKRMLRALLRGLTGIAVASKLLVPVGYMPSALADGGPFALCGGGPAGGTALTAQSQAAEHQQQSAEQLPSDHHSAHHPSPAAHGETGAETSPTSGHDHGDDSLDHGPWERCALGGLASLAPLAAEWPLAVPSLVRDETPHAETAATWGRSVAVVRSRGPPHLPV